MILYTLRCGVQINSIKTNLDASEDSMRFLMRVSHKSDQICLFYYKYELGGSMASMLGMSVASTILWFRSGLSFDPKMLYHVFDVA